jgi:hypothetical protein
MNTRTKLLETPEENDIIIAMGLLFKDNENQNLLIIKQYENRSEIFLGVRNKQTYEAYKQEYEYRTLTNMSCLDLKREITKNMDLPKKRTYVPKKED